MPDLYKIEIDGETAAVLEEMRQKIADSKAFGVTLQGNRLTLRWHMDERLVDVHMVIVDATTPSEARESLRQYEEYRKVMGKYKDQCPDLEEDFYYAEHGEHSQ